MAPNFFAIWTSFHLKRVVLFMASWRIPPTCSGSSPAIISLTSDALTEGGRESRTRYASISIPTVVPNRAERRTEITRPSASFAL